MSTRIQLYTLEVTITHDGRGHFVATKAGRKVGELHVMILESTLPGKESAHWLNGVYIPDPQDRRQGIATRLVQAAVDEYGSLLISSASAYEHKVQGDTSARELTGQGDKLVRALIARGIVRKEWLTHPFQNDLPETWL